jgi:hypothetical protein
MSHPSPQHGFPAMLFTRLFQTLEHPASPQEVASPQAFRRAKHLIRQELAGPVVVPRGQRGGVIGGGRRLNTPTLWNGIIPTAGVFIP